jgi:DNA-binding NarL/FixJ family response regulator
MLTVAVSAGTPIVRNGLARMIGASGRYRLGEVVEELSALRSGEDSDADVVVAQVGGASRAADLSEGRPGLPPLVVLADDWPGKWLIRQFELHGGALLRADARAEALFAAIDAAGAGLVAIERRAFERAGRLRFDAERPTDGTAPGEALTEREAEVLELLADGHSNKAIARALKLSEHTAKFHVSAVLAKLGAATRTEAVSLGIRRGLISL